MPPVNLLSISTVETLPNAQHSEWLNHKAAGATDLQPAASMKIHTDSVRHWDGEAEPLWAEKDCLYFRGILLVHYAPEVPLMVESCAWTYIFFHERYESSRIFSKCSKDDIFYGLWNGSLLKLKMLNYVHYHYKCQWKLPSEMFLSGQQNKSSKFLFYREQKILLIGSTLKHTI